MKTCCPNCGYTSKIKDFTNGCPFCGTYSNMDYHEKKYGVSTFINLLTGKKIKFSIILLSAILSILCGINTYGIAGIFFALPLFFPLMFVVYLCIIPIIIPIVIYQIVINHKNTAIWYQIQKVGIVTTQKSFFNCLHTELINYYYTEKLCPKYNNLIDFDIISYTDFKFQPIGNLEAYVTVEYKIRKVYFENYILRISIEKNIVKLTQNNFFDVLKNNHTFINCGNCVASISLVNKRCEYCGNTFDYKNEWTIEEFIKDCK